MDTCQDPNILTPGRGVLSKQQVTQEREEMGFWNCIIQFKPREGGWEREEERERKREKEAGG